MKDVLLIGWDSHGPIMADIEVSDFEIEKFCKDMKAPIKRGKNVGKKRTLANIKECAWSRFSGYPRNVRSKKTDMLFKAYQKSIKKWRCDICNTLTKNEPDPECLPLCDGCREEYIDSP